MASMSLLIAGSVTQFASNKINMQKARKRFSKLGKSEGAGFLKKSEETGATDSVEESLKQDPIKQKTAALAARLKGGGRLTGAEVKWLEEHDPALAEKAKAVEERREEYKQRLRDCRTKQDVAMAKMAVMSDVSKEIPSHDDADKAETLLMHIAAIHNEHVKFTSSAEYKNLPDKDEEAVDYADEKRRDKEKKFAKFIKAAGE